MDKRFKAVVERLETVAEHQETLFKIALRMMDKQAVEKGDADMLIFLSKNWLGMHD